MRKLSRGFARSNYRNIKAGIRRTNINPVYFDNASTTRCSDGALAVFEKYAKNSYFNPSAMYRAGMEIKNDIEKARAEILSLLKAEGNLIFTSSGTESDNLAIFGTKKQNSARIIISDAEHAAVYYSANILKQRGFDVVFAPVDGTGKVIEDEFIKLVDGNTAFVSIMHVNNETGAVNDIKTLCKAAKEKSPKLLFHSDGVQAFGKLKINLRSFGVDLYSISSHKIRAQKGTGALFVKKGVSIAPAIIGGGQENGFRSSTENTGGIMAFAYAARTAYENSDENYKKIKELKDYIYGRIKAENELKPLFSDNSSPYILTFASGSVRGEVMQHALEHENILIGTGSACASNKSTDRIPDALGLKGKYKRGIMRLSFGIENTMDEAEFFTEKFIKIYGELAKYGS